MAYQHITIKPVAGALGAEIGNVDLADLSDETFTEIRQAWLENGVVFFRDQHITPEQQIAFAKRFGEIHYHPYMRGLDEHPEILEIVKEPGDSYTFGSVWHTDQMFNPRPAMATMLYAKESPSRGGDTMFSNQYLAHDSLSEAMRGMLAEVRTFNVGDGFRQERGAGTRRDRYVNNPTMAAKVMDPPKDLQTESEHPLVRTHPETGRKLIYIGSHTKTLVGFAESEAKLLIDYLRAHSIRSEFTCRFRWEPGSLALWDNRCVQHCALADYSERRRMHRITIAGDAPY